MLAKVIISGGLILKVLGNPPSDTSLETSFDWSLPVLLGLGLIFINIALANAAGIGGAPITVCVLLNIMKFDSMKALANCQVSILGGSLIATLIKTTYKHPYNKSAPLIFYDLVAYLSGLLVAGSSTGTLLTRIAQPWMSLAGLIILVWLISIISYIKGRELYIKETEKNSVKKSLSVPLLQSSRPESQFISIFLIFISLTLLFFYSLIKGDQRFTSILGIQQCSIQYFAVIIGYFFMVLGITLLISMYLINKNKTQKHTSESFQFNSKNMVLLPVTTYITGVISGSLGIGGASMLNPLLIFYGILPEVSTACCNVFVVLTSLSSLLQFYMAGLIQHGDALILLLISLAGSAMSTLVIKRLIDRYKRASILVFLLSGMLALVGLILPVNLFLELTKEMENGMVSFELQSIC